MRPVAPSRRTSTGLEHVDGHLVAGATTLSTVSCGLDLTDATASRHDPDAPDEIALLTADGPTLAGDLRVPAGAPAGAILCHPHPAHGGDRHNVVVDALYRALSSAGVATLRFDFRPLGPRVATGEGVAERADVVAALPAWRSSWTTPSPSPSSVLVRGRRRAWPSGRPPRRLVRRSRRRSGSRARRDPGRATADRCWCWPRARPLSRRPPCGQGHPDLPDVTVETVAMPTTWLGGHAQVPSGHRLGARPRCALADGADDDPGTLHLVLGLGDGVLAGGRSTQRGPRPRPRR